MWFNVHLAAPRCGLTCIAHPVFSSPAASEGLATSVARPSDAAGLELHSNTSQKSGNSHNFIPGLLQISNIEKKIKNADSAVIT